MILLKNERELVLPSVTEVKHERLNKIQNYSH